MGNEDPLEPNVCRACLATDVTLFDLHKIGQANNFADLTRTEVDLSDGLPQYVCCYCRAQLLRCTKFRTKCQEAHLYLQEIQKEHMITTDYVKNLDRTKFSTPFSHTKVETIDFYFHDEIIPRDSDLRYDFKPKFENIKRSLLSNFDEFDDDDDDREVCEQPISFDGMKDTNNDSNITLKANVKTEGIEEETDSSNPLIELQKNKEDNVKSIKRIVSKTEPKKQEKKRAKKSNRYNEKFADEYVEFSKLYNVRVIFLSKEEQIQRIEERKESKEYKESRFSCDMCYKGFLSEAAHKRHMKAHDPSSGAFVCLVCHLRYGTQVALNSHVRTHKKIFECTLCDMINVTAHRAQLHFRWHKGDKFECKTCHKQFKARQTHLNHVREVHKPLSCPQCGEALNGTNQLNKHMGLHQEQNECSTCAVQFQSSEALVRHRKDNECNGTNVLKPCVLCGQNLSCRVGLSEHMKLEHGGESYTCNECGAAYSSDKSLSIHYAFNHSKRVKRHSKKGSEFNNSAKTNEDGNQSEYLCEICAKSFPCPVKLKMHLRTHNFEKPFRCPMCPKSFRAKVARDVHINVHTGARPYKCRLCPEMFKSYSQRYKHKLLVHTDERRYKCSMCDKTYVIAYDLKAHVRYAHLHQPRPPRNRRRKRCSAKIE